MEVLQVQWGLKVDIKNRHKCDRAKLVDRCRVRYI